MGGGGSKEDVEVQIHPNPIDEVQIFDSHNGHIVWCIAKIDERRLASADDNGVVIIWDYVSGRKLFQMKHHNQKVNCLLVVPVEGDKRVLVSGSSDKSICIYDVYSGKLLHTLQSHKASVTCLSLISNQPGVFCSGGNEQNIFMWNAHTGENKGKILRKDDENLKCMISLPNNRLATGSCQYAIYVYNTETLEFDALVNSHGGSIQCLANINGSLFASGSLDGSVVVTHSESLSSMCQLLPPTKSSLHTINKLIPIGDNYLAVALGTGLKVFHIDSKKMVFEHTGLISTVTDVVPLYKCTRIVSCFEDGSVSLFGSTKHLQSGLPNVFNIQRPQQPKTPKNIKQQTQSHQFINSTSSNKSQQNGSVKSSNKPVPLFHSNTPIEPCTLGTMSVHSDSVCQIVALSDHSFATCGKDGYVILWKDGRVENELRNNNAAERLEKDLRRFSKRTKVPLPPYSPDIPRASTTTTRSLRELDYVYSLN